MEKPLCSPKRKPREVDPQVSLRRNHLFQKYIVPYYNMIYKLTMKYSFHASNVEENYNEVLVNLYHGIETYDPNRPIKTWIHIVTKRYIYELERKRVKYCKNNEHVDIDECDIDRSIPSTEKPSYRLMGFDNYEDFYNDDILEVLNMLKPMYRDALVLQEAGYSLKEIADIEFEKRRLRSHNINTIKSRIFLAKRFLKKRITRDGKRKVDKEYNNSLHRN